jgi:hypothetical protein
MESFCAMSCKSCPTPKKCTAKASSREPSSKDPPRPLGGFAALWTVSLIFFFLTFSCQKQPVHSSDILLAMQQDDDDKTTGFCYVKFNDTYAPHFVAPIYNPDFRGATTSEAFTFLATSKPNQSRGK